MRRITSTGRFAVQEESSANFLVTESIVAGDHKCGGKRCGRRPSKWSPLYKHTVISYVKVTDIGSKPSESGLLIGSYLKLHVQVKVQNTSVPLTYSIFITISMRTPSLHESMPLKPILPFIPSKKVGSNG